MTREELYNAVDALPWKYQIGDILAHVGQVNPHYHKKFNRWGEMKQPQRFVVVERSLQQCYGGVQMHYLCTIAEGNGSAVTTSLSFRYTEPELVPYPTDIQWEHEPSPA